MFRKIADIRDILKESKGKFVLIFKHSLICPVSITAQNEIEAFLIQNPTYPIYLIVVQNEHNLSNKISSILQVRHESPQLLLIKNGNVQKVLNHYQISLKNIEDFFKKETA